MALLHAGHGKSVTSSHTSSGPTLFPNFPDPSHDVYSRLTQAFRRWSLHFGNGTAVCQVLCFCLGESTRQQRAIFLPVGKGEEASPPANIELGLLRVAGEAVHGSPDSLSAASPLSLYRELLCFDTSGLCPQGLLWRALRATLTQAVEPTTSHLQRCSGPSRRVSLALLGRGCHLSQRGPIKS